MYISRIHITGFRNFRDTSIDFNDGMNVIIGHNNAGKSNLLKALQLVVDYQCKNRKLGFYDFYRSVSLQELKSKSPAVTISVYLRESTNSGNESPDDIVMVSNWFTVVKDGEYEAMLTYRFSLQPDKEVEYLAAMAETDDPSKAWRIIQEDFLRYYVYGIYGGDLSLSHKAEFDNLKKFDFQFLEALRNVEDELFSGKNQMLREVLDFFIDYQIKSDPDKGKEEKDRLCHEIKKEFHENSSELINYFLERLEHGKNEMLQYANDTGASFNNAKPDFNGDLTDYDLFGALRLMVKYETGMEIAATHNGLGYNNLIYISLLLAKMQADSDGNYLGSSAKVYPILAIEEPEAHLHPSMQYKFLKFLKKNLSEKRKARQVFITTHSTQITSAVPLDDIICLHSSVVGECQVGYPVKVFTNSREDVESKKYVQRFLDATNSDMLFAQRVLMVEGIAEELLIKTLAKYTGLSFEDAHCAIVNVNGRYFKHFIKLFDKKRSDFALPKRVACITDRDPERKGNNEKSHKSCYPFEYGMDNENYTYKKNATEDMANYAVHPNIHFFSQDEQKGKTFEYDIVLHNPTLKLLITPSMKNQEEISKLMESESLDAAISELRNSKENERIIESLNACQWEEKDKINALIATRYLNSVGKGENALDLCVVLEENYDLSDVDADKMEFVVPAYIKDALGWLLQ